MSSPIQLTAAAVEEIVKKYLDENLDARVDARLDARLDLKLEESRKALLADLAKMLPGSAPTGTAGKPAAKASKAVDPAAPPKEKRPPNAWIIFTIRVEKLVRDAEKAAEEKRAAETPEEPKKAPLHTMVTKQFASYLKEQKAYEEWADEEITEALTTWTPPETSKRAATKAEKASDTGSVAGSEAPAIEKPAAGATGEKPKRQWSEETKAAAAAKRAATLAKKAAEKAGAATEVVAAAEAVAVAVAVPAAPTAVAKKTIAIKPKAAAPVPAKPVDLSFFSWTHEGKSYYTNDRGDVVTEDFEWVGRFDGAKIDESVAEPEDLGNATLRGE